MFQDRGATGATNWPITDGMTVYASDGEKLGTVQDYDPRTAYLEVRKGWLFPKDFFVPTNAIARVDDDGLILRLTKDELAEARYDAPPMALSDVDVPYTDTRSAANSTVRGSTAEGSLSAGEDIRVPVREEELVVGKERQEEGRVYIHKDVVSEQQTLDVPLQHERVTVERVPYRGDAANTTELFEERDIDVPVMGEKAVVGKRIQGVEEVSIHKDVITDQEQVSDTVRKERVTVDGADERGRATAGQSAGDRVRSAAQNVGDDPRDTGERFTGR